MLKNLSIFLTKKRKVFLILVRTQELSNDIGLIAFFQFLIFFFSFTVIFFFILLEDGPIKHKKKIIHSQFFSELTRLLKLIFKNSRRIWWKVNVLYFSKALHQHSKITLKIKGVKTLLLISFLISCGIIRIHDCSFFLAFVDSITPQIYVLAEFWKSYFILLK